MRFDAVGEDAVLIRFADGFAVLFHHGIEWLEDPTTRLELESLARELRNYYERRQKEIDAKNPDRL